MTDSTMNCNQIHVVSQGYCQRQLSSCYWMRFCYALIIFVQHSCTETHEKLALMLNFWSKFFLKKKGRADVIFEKILQVDSGLV